MNTISIIMFVIGCTILFFSLMVKNSNFLDIHQIFIQHFQVFKGNPLQFFSIFLVPIFLSVGIVGVKCVDKDILSNLNIILSILVAMFFSMLSILCSFDKEKKNEKYRQLLKETFNTTVFEVIICLVLLLVSFIALFVGSFDKSIPLEIVSGVIYYLAIVLILNILVVIKRIKVLFDNK